MEKDGMHEACSKHRSDEEIKHLVIRSEMKRSFRKSKCRYEESNKVDLKKEYSAVVWTQFSSSGYGLVAGLCELMFHSKWGIS
jgi:hypothetical protein